MHIMQTGLVKEDAQLWPYFLTLSTGMWLFISGNSWVVIWQTVLQRHSFQTDRGLMELMTEEIVHNGLCLMVHVSIHYPITIMIIILLIIEIKFLAKNRSKHSQQNYRSQAALACNPAGWTKSAWQNMFDHVESSKRLSECWLGWYWLQRNCQQLSLSNYGLIARLEKFKLKYVEYMCT
jgi:hypothetical protein